MPVADTACGREETTISGVLDEAGTTPRSATISIARVAIDVEQTSTTLGAPSNLRIVKCAAVGRERPAWGAMIAAINIESRTPGV